jgi:hypothetical protein
MSKLSKEQKEKAHSSVMKMESEFSSEIPVYLYETMRLRSQNIGLVVFVCHN